MNTYGISMDTGSPMTGRRLVRLKDFLQKFALIYDEGIEYTCALVNEEYEYIGTGSVDGNVLKCIAIDERYQGEGLMATILTDLITYCINRGREHLFLYTKPKNRILFEGLGFFSIAQTEYVLLMENKRNGISAYVEQLQLDTQEFVNGLSKAPKTIGAIVANCNPFTLGHQYLMEEAARRCDLLHVFVVSSEKSMFSAKARMDMVKAGVAHIPNLIVHDTHDYLVSPATFPTYFLKDQSKALEINCALDIQIFIQYIVANLHITHRFLGTEPISLVTNAYNQQLKMLLPPAHVEVIELTRKEFGSQPISASRVRACIEANDWSTIQEIVPPTTYHYLKKLYS